MSNVYYNSHAKLLTLVDYEGNQVGRCNAQTQTANKFKHPSIPVGVHSMQDPIAVHLLSPGSLGTRTAVGAGIFRASPLVANKGQHAGAGITAAAHANGSIQTSQEAMRAIGSHVVKDPLRTLTVQNFINEALIPGRSGLSPIPQFRHPHPVHPGHQKQRGE